MKKSSKKMLRRSTVILLPAAVDIKVRPVGRQSRNYEFCYWEGFYPRPESEALVNRTIDALSMVLKMQGVKVTIARSDLDGYIGVVLTGKLSRGKIGDMIAGEFLGWSDMADQLTLRQMLTQVAGSMVREGHVLHQAAQIK